MSGTIGRTYPVKSLLFQIVPDIAKAALSSLFQDRRLFLFPHGFAIIFLWMRYEAEAYR
jgi:hypothetical protein